MKDDSAPLIEHIATVIRRERRNLNLSMEQLAENSNVSIQTIKDIEHAKRICQIDTLVSIASALHLSMDYILGLPYTDLRVTEFETIYRILNSKQRNLILNIARVVAQDY